MVNYIEMAKQVAEDRRHQEAIKAERKRVEMEFRSDKVYDAMRRLKEELKKWHRVNGFSYKDEGPHQHVDCASIYIGKDKILGFQCHWTHYHENAVGSDDCSWDFDGIEINMHHYYEDHPPVQYRSGDIVNSCMKGVVEYLSRFF